MYFCNSFHLMISASKLKYISTLNDKLKIAIKLFYCKEEFVGSKEQIHITDINLTIYFITNVFYFHIKYPWQSAG